MGLTGGQRKASWAFSTDPYHTRYVNITMPLLQANTRIAAFTAVAVDILGMWLRTMLDDGKRSALKYFTLVSPALRLPGHVKKMSGGARVGGWVREETDAHRRAT